MSIKTMIKSDNKWSRLGGVALVAVMMFGMGVLVGYIKGTGTMPLQASSPSVVPSDSVPSVTEAELVQFLASDTTSGIQYGEGFNCVEYAFVLGLRGRWQGLQAEVIRVDFDNQPYGHLLLAYDTSDKGTVYINPADDSIVKPIIGGELAGKRITGLYVLRASWQPLGVDNND